MCVRHTDMCVQHTGMCVRHTYLCVGHTYLCFGHTYLSYRAHVPSPLRRGGLGGLCPPREAGGFGGLQAPQWLTPDWGMRGGVTPSEFRGMTSSPGMIKAGVIQRTRSLEHT